MITMVFLCLYTRLTRMFVRSGFSFDEMLTFISHFWCNAQWELVAYVVELIFITCLIINSCHLCSESWNLQTDQRHYRLGWKLFKHSFQCITCTWPMIWDTNADVSDTVHLSSHKTQTSTSSDNILAQRCWLDDSTWDSVATDTKTDRRIDGITRGQLGYSRGQVFLTRMLGQSSLSSAQILPPYPGGWTCWTEPASLKGRPHNPG